MKKRQKKKIAKRQGCWASLTRKPPEIPISVTQIGLVFTSSEETSDESVSSHTLSPIDVKALAEELRQWIEEYGFANTLSQCFPRHCDSFGKTLFLDELSEVPSRPIWFIGDLHGDLVALQALTNFARIQDTRDNIGFPTRLFFLGDFTDDAPFSAEIVAWVMRHNCTSWHTLQQKNTKPCHAEFEVMSVVGNHDDGLRFIENNAGGKFISTVSPSSFAEGLNERMKGEHGEAWKAFGKAAIEFFLALPRMVLLNKNIMVAHGGVPHSDVLIHQREDLNSLQALSDFVWNRLHETAPKKIPNRESRGSQLGINDFNGFISNLKEKAIIGVAPTVFIRGHDHHDGNFKRYASYKGCSVVTLNAFTVNRCSLGQKYRDLALLRWVPSEGTKMILFRLSFQDGALKEMWRTLVPEEKNVNTVGKE